MILTSLPPSTTSGTAVTNTGELVRAVAIKTISDRRLIRGVPSILRRLDLEQDEFVRDVTLSALKRLEGEVG